MKLLKKLNTYLLENQPLLWHTRSIQLTLSGILLWLLSFVVGYVSLGLPYLRSSRIDSFYFNSNFIFLHVVALVVLFAFWAIYFYKNNAFKSYYPLNKFYFHKMHLLLFIPILLLISAYFPFTYGSFLKTRSLLDAKELAMDADKINEVAAFLPSSGNDYRLAQKNYPGPFPLEINEYSFVDKEWGNRYRKTFVADSLGNRIIKDYIIDKKNTTEIEGKYYQFYKEENFRDKEDTCDSHIFITKFYAFDETKDFLRLNSIYNFSNSDLITRNFEFLFDYNLKEVRNDILPEVHKTVKLKDYSEIARKINVLKSVLEKYGIRHRLEPQKITSYLNKKNFNELSGIINSHESRSKILYDRLHQKSMTITDYNALPIDERLEFFSKQFVDESEIRSIFSNYNKSIHSVQLKTAWYPFLFIAVSLALFFIYFQIVKPIPFLISIPVWGVLFILLGLSFAFYRVRSDIAFTMTFFLFFVGIQIANILIIRAKGIGKRLADISISMAVISSGFVLPLLGVCLHILSEKRITDACLHYTEKYIFSGLLNSPIALLILGVVGLYTALFLTRVWKAKEE